MDRIYIKNLHTHIGKKVTIAGWIDVRRDHGKLIFVDVRDCSGTIQAVGSAKNKDVHDVLMTVRSEWVVKIEGEVKKRPENMVKAEFPTGDIELEIQNIFILGRAEEIPFGKDESVNFDTHLDYLPLTLRTPRSKAIFKVQAEILKAFREFLNKEGFVEFQAPKIIGEDAEGGASVFEVDYFGRIAHLAQSPQFYKQIMVGVFEKVFTTGNVFRAEKHSTTRHLNEYTSLDLEFGFIKDHEDIMKLGSRLLSYIVETVVKNCSEEMKLVGAHAPETPTEFPHMKLRAAQKIIEEKYGEKCDTEPDLTPQQEKWICEYAKKKFHSDFIYITHFPVEKRPMYTYEDTEDKGYTKGFDLLFRGLEINTGSQRIHEYGALVENMKRKKVDPERFTFYLQAFKYGMPPHGGFGMGLERLTARLLLLDNVKEATLFPREINRIDKLLSE